MLEDVTNAPHNLEDVTNAPHNLEDVTAPHNLEDVTNAPKFRYFRGVRGCIRTLLSKHGYRYIQNRIYTTTRNISTFKSSKVTGM